MPGEYLSWWLASTSGPAQCGTKTDRGAVNCRVTIPTAGLAVNHACAGRMDLVNHCPPIALSADRSVSWSIDRLFSPDGPKTVAGSLTAAPFSPSTFWQMAAIIDRPSCLDLNAHKKEEEPPKLLMMTEAPYPPPPPHPLPPLVVLGAKYLHKHWGSRRRWHFPGVQCSDVAFNKPSRNTNSRVQIVL